ncbi:MAG: hypothetical protein Q9169_008193 [Polycauliona sp. 2 TL-2023]
MDNQQDDETVRRWKTDEEDKVLRRETMMNYSDQQAVRAGLQPAHAGARQPQRRQIENRGNDRENDDLRILDDIDEMVQAAQPVRKKKRPLGR